MNRSEEYVQATNRKQWLTFITLAIVLIIVTIFWREETLLLSHRMTLVFMCILVCAYSFWRAIHFVVINNYGISCYYFGKLAHSIAWSEVGEIMLIRDYRINLGSSGNRRLVVIPKGCPTYDPHKWFGVQYLFLFRTRVIWMDNTMQSRKIIEEQYGSIINRS